MTADSGWVRWRLSVVALLVVVLSLLGLAVWPESLLAQSVAISLVTTGLLAILFDRLVRPGYQEQISTATGRALDEMDKVTGRRNREITATVRNALDEMPEIIGRQIDAAPSRIYPASNKQDKSFNLDINQETVRSSRYLFQGVSGQYVAARLPDPPDTRPADIRLVLVHPADATAIHFRALERLHDPLYRGQGLTLDDHVVRVRTDIRRSIVAFFDHRHLHDVRIGFAEGTALVTMEVFDEAAFVRAWPDGSNRTTFPETYRFDGSSRLYDLFRRAFETQLQQCKIDLHFKKDWQDAQLIGVLCDLGYSDYGPADLTDDRRRCAEFRKDYLDRL